MSEPDKPSASPFDLDRLVELIQLMEKHGLTEVCLRRGDEKWKLRRGGLPVAEGAPAGQHAFPAAPAAAEGGAGGAKSAASNDRTVTINSPTVGTFYASPTPDDPAFVTAGTRVQPETVVCIVEAMKVFNQIPAEVSGTVIQVLVTNGDSVEFGQPLFRVRLD